MGGLGDGSLGIGSLGIGEDTDATTGPTPRPYDITNYWRIDTATDLIPADYHRGEQPLASVGDSVDRGLVFDRRDGDHRRDHTERFNAVASLADHAGAFTLETTIRDDPIYAEHRRDRSLLVALRPPSWFDTGRGLWGLVDSVSDDTNTPQTLWGVTLSIVYLAPLARFGSHAAVRAAYERTGFH